MWVDFAASCFRCQTCTLAVRIRRTVAHNYYRAASHTTFFSPSMIFWRGCCSQLPAIFRTGKNKWVVAGALPMPTNHGHTPWKMAKFIFRNFLTILVDTVAPNFIFWAHCAQNWNFLTIFGDTCAKLKLFDNFRWHSAQNWNVSTILGDTMPKIETFWQF